MKIFSNGPVLFSAMLMSAAAFGQDFSGAAPAGIDFSGYYVNIFQQDPQFGTAAGPLVDWGGIPINEAARLYGLAWDASRITVRQQQCPGYTPPYIFYAPQNYRIWEERDPITQKLVAVQTYGQTSEALHTIWMDGRPHPPAWAPHTFSGFATGKWEANGNILTAYTTHIKRGWERATGMPQSDAATVIEHFIRHGDRITYVSITTDPVYLSEPWVRTLELVRREKDPNAWLYACDDSEEILDKAEDRVPSYLWGKHPYLTEAADKEHVPLLGNLGGAATMHPEFAAKLKNLEAADAAARAELFPTPGPEQSSRAPDPDPHDGEIHTWRVQGNVYMLIGDGANIAVQAADQGVFVVDTGAGKLTDKVIEAIRKIVPDPTKPIQFVLDTSVHADHIGGNVKIHAAGADPSLPGSFFSGAISTAGQGATIIAHQNVQDRMLAAIGKASAPDGTLPTDTYLEGRRRKFYNDEGIEIFWMPHAVTDGDSIIHFRRSDVIATGDIFDSTRYPFIDVKLGGTIQGEIDALDFILDRTIYRAQEDGGTMIIPGHGRVCNEYEVAEYRDMLVIFRDRVQAMIKQGATLDQVKAARLTADYDTQFGATTGPWTNDMFVEAIYTSLKQTPAKAAKN